MTTTDTTFETRLEVPQNSQALTVTRHFRATPEQVFRAHIDPEIYMSWVGPDSITSTVREWDATTGGRWSYLSEDESGEYGFFGSFHEVRKNERIVQTFTFEGFPDAVSLEILNLVDLGSGMTRIESTSIFDSVEARDAMVASGMEHGIVEGYTKLDKLLPSL